MRADEWERLETVMARLAGGDRATVVTLFVEFGGRVAGVVRRHLRRMGVDGIARDDLDGLTFDACDAIGGCAAGWDPAKRVLPWTWADRRIANVVAAWVGQHADPLGDDLGRLPAATPAPSVEPLPHDLLERSDEPMCRLLRDAFDAARISPRDRRLLVETRVQAALGDPAPAASVAPLYGMEPAAVRQAVKRARDKLADLARRDAAFAPLADLALLS